MSQINKSSGSRFLPINKKDMELRGWDELDILFISGDAYIDHPAFGTSLLARLLENAGYKVGILAQPDWKNPEAFKVMGRPRLFAAISAGAMDSMVNHYTAGKKIRRNDAYTPGGLSGKRPNRAVIAYTAAIKGAFKGLPTIIGGIEASLRRFAHYDYWDDKVRRSILVDSKADLLIYGMAETPILEISRKMAAGEPVDCLRNIRGTAFLTTERPEKTIAIPSFEEMAENGNAYNEAFRHISDNSNPFSASSLAQQHGKRFLVANPPAMPLSSAELDRSYDLPFTRRPHPSYAETIPAFEQIRHSITSHRGCFGGCAFCAITHHQGKIVQSRSERSILEEVKQLTSQPDFHGTISDVGGPTANMYGLSCKDMKTQSRCCRHSCLFPDVCKNLQTDATSTLSLLKRIQQHDKVRHLFIASGIRYDLLPYQEEYFDNLLRHHVGGLLKVAPESTLDRVTAVMRKPGAKIFTSFLEQFQQRNRALGLRHGIVPYLISGHPGCTLNDMVDVALYLKRHHLKVEQVQDFTPTPGSLSTCMYFTGKDPFTGRKVHVPRSDKEKRLQKALLLYHLPESAKAIREALKLCHREEALEQLLELEKNSRSTRGKPSRRDPRGKRKR